MNSVDTKFKNPVNFTNSILNVEELDLEFVGELDIAIVEESDQLNWPLTILCKANWSQNTVELVNYFVELVLN